jgi:hypothetical protein
MIRKILRTIGATLAIALVIIASSAAPASTLRGRATASSADTSAGVMSTRPKSLK